MSQTAAAACAIERERDGDPAAEALTVGANAAQMNYRALVVPLAKIQADFGGGYLAASANRPAGTLRPNSALHQKHFLIQPARSVLVVTAL